MKKMFVILTVLILSVGFFACDNGGGGGGGSEKILIVNNVTDDLLQAADSDMGLGIYPVGTSFEDALDWVGLVAGATYYDISKAGTSPNIVVTVELYLPSGGKRWTGSGTYDIFMLLNGNGDGYIKRNVSIASETTYLDATSFDDKIEDGKIVE